MVRPKECERSQTSMMNNVADTNNTERLRAALVAIAKAARPSLKNESDPEWHAARQALENAEIIPPACIIAPAFLPGVDYYMLHDAARNAIEYIRHCRRLQAAQAALRAAENNGQMLILEAAYTGWSAKEARRALEEAQAQCRTFRRE
jgi:hypothetical protein